MAARPAKPEEAAAASPPRRASERHKSLSDAVDYFEPHPRSPWTFRLAVLGVLLGAMAITMEARSLAHSLSRSVGAQAVRSGDRPLAESTRAPEPPPEAAQPPPSAQPPQSTQSPEETPPAAAAPDLMLAADATVLASGSSRMPPPAPAPPSPKPVFIPLDEDVPASLEVLAGQANERRRRAGKRGGSGLRGMGGTEWSNASEAEWSYGERGGNGSWSRSGWGNATYAGKQGGGKGQRRRGRRSGADRSTAEEGGGDAVGGGMDGTAGEISAYGDDGQGAKGRSGRIGGGENGKAGDGRPNLVLMLADDAAVSDIGVFDSTGAGRQKSTPNIDALGRRGVRFLNAHAASPLCTPSRFAILTGQRPACAAKATTLKSLATASALTSQAPVPSSVSYDSYPRPSRHRTLGHRLKEVGYATGMVGLWHLGAPEPVSSKKDLKRVLETEPAKYAHAAGGKVKKVVAAEYAALQEHVKKVGGFEFADRLYAAPLDSEAVILPSAMKVHNVEWVADGASRFIQSRAMASAPFFLYIGWTLPHGPDAEKSLMEGKMGYTPAGTWKPSQALAKVSQATRSEVRRKAKGKGEGDEEPISFQGHKNYATALQWLDRGVGTVMWALQHKGVMHETLVAFASDHGNVDKGHCYLQGTQTPLLMQWPDSIAGALTVRSAVSLLDVTSTFLDAAGVSMRQVAVNQNWTASTDPVSVDPPLHGASLLPLLRGAAPGSVISSQLHEHIVCEVGPTRALMTAQHKYIFSPVPGGRKGSPPDYGASERHPGKKFFEQLYSINDDPSEVVELISAHALLAASPAELSTNATISSNALAALRAVMQADLAMIDKACGVA